MRGRSVSCDTRPTKPFIVNKQSIIKIHKPIAHPIEIGNGYGYFCNIDIVDTHTHTDTVIHIDMYKDVQGNDVALNNPYDSYGICCCIPFVLFGLSVLFV